MSSPCWDGIRHWTVWVGLIAGLALAGCRFDPVGNLGEKAATCGNGIREGDEQCDGEDLGGHTCVNLGYEGGTLSCGDDCRFNASDCQGQGACGNQVKDEGEECDGPSLGGETCSTVAGLSEGDLACDAHCHFDVSGCYECGNGILEPAEACDGTNFGGETCETKTGNPDGELTCGTSCMTIGVNHCHECGNGSLEPGEDCDGSEFGGKGCSDYGFASGELTCTGACRIDTSTCSNSTCGNGICDETETASSCPQECGWIFLSVAEGDGGGAGHACAIRADQTLWCWGHNDKGQLGDGTTTDRNVPVQVDLGAAMSSPVAVACGGQHTCSLFEDGTVWCWGRGELGQLGDGNGTDSTVPVAVAMPDGVSGFSALDAGMNFNCALSQVGEVWCWGSHDKQVLGVGGNQDALEPVHAVTTLDGEVTALSLGAEHACAHASDDSIWCWGRDDKGQLGDGQQGPDRVAPQAVVNGDNNSGSLAAQFVTAGGKHTCAVTASGESWCWGLDDKGQLGDGQTTDSPVPLPVQDDVMGAVTILSAGHRDTCGIDTAGALWCWGDNGVGQLGNGNTSDHEDSPVAGGPLSAAATQVAVAPEFACAIDLNFRLWCWGRNDVGQLGNGTTNDSASPVEVADP